MLRAFVLLTALAVTAPTLTAQPDTLTYTGPGQGTTDGKFFVGPYNGNLDHNAITMNCVDVFHQIVTGETWAVNISPLSGSLVATRANSLPLYEEAAFLTTQYANAHTATDTANIQHAIWRLFASNTALANAGLGYMINSGSDSWLSLASSDYASAGINYSLYEVITPTDPSDPNSGQEVLTSVPEPSSLAFLGTGLVGLVPLVRRRKRA